MPLVFPWPKGTAKKFLLNLMSKMPSTASAKTQSSKPLKHTSQKSIPSYGTASPQIHPSFMENSALSQLPVCSNGTPLSNPLCPRHPRCYVQGKILSKCVVLGWRFVGGDPRTVLSNVATARKGLSTIGLEINNSKCELLVINHTTN